MNTQWLPPLALALLLCGAGVARGDVLTVVQSLRGIGCGGVAPAAPRLRPSARLDRAAGLWADGTPIGDAVDHSGYPAQRVAGIHLNGPEDAATRALRDSNCKHVTDADLQDVGVRTRGADTWLILASPYRGVSQALAPQVSARILTLVNTARSRGERCGARTFAAAGPLTLAARLASVAAGHAKDMAKKGYLDHRDKAGRSPAERVRAGGYRHKAVGENIARGPGSADDVFQGWMQSPGHCENIMDPRFTEMGIAYVPASASRHELYWVQLLAAPGD